ncbi:MAG TPA: LysM domain-containing protein, partial [Saprospiraceae bacterium]|nr:LysM domain-containing protein [Saprospiraceae bacterium]
VPSNESDPIENLPMGQKIEHLAIIQRRYNLVRDNFKESSKLKALAKVLLPDSEKPILYKMKRKESLMDIAKANDIPLNDLLAFNNIDPDKGLPPGSIIRISK